MDTPAANRKLAEVEFFFTLMEKHLDHYEFQYFLSAFLSALKSCTEHNRLQSADPRFAGWYEEMKTSCFADETSRGSVDCETARCIKRERDLRSE